MFDSEFSFLNLLTSFESVLKLDYNAEDRVEDIINRAIQSLESTYGCDFSKDVFTLRAENQLSADNLNIFLRDVRQCLAEMSLYTQLKLFHKNMPINLADINYLSTGKAALLTSLRYLQDKESQQRNHDELIQPLINALNNVPTCQPKRLFIYLLMFDRLGITEGVAIVAELLYLGGL